MYTLAVNSTDLTPSMIVRFALSAKQFPYGLYGIVMRICATTFSKTTLTALLRYSAALSAYIFWGFRTWAKWGKLYPDVYGCRISTYVLIRNRPVRVKSSLERIRIKEQEHINRVATNIYENPNTAESSSSLYFGMCGEWCLDSRDKYGAKFTLGSKFIPDFSRNHKPFTRKNNRKNQSKCVSRKRISSTCLK